MSMNQEGDEQCTRQAESVPCSLSLSLERRSENVEIRDTVNPIDIEAKNEGN